MDAIEWFVTTFPPSIQEQVRAFLNHHSCRYLKGLEIEVNHPEQGLAIEERRAYGYYERKHWQKYVNDAEISIMR